MKLTRWGYAKFNKPQTAYVAVVVPHMEDGKMVYRWVTTLWYQGLKEWRCENHKKAQSQYHLFLKFSLLSPFRFYFNKLNSCLFLSSLSLFEFLII